MIRHVKIAAAALIAASGATALLGGCSAKPSPTTESPSGRWSGITHVSCRNVSDTVLTMRLVKNRHHPELGELAAITSGKGATLEVSMEMPSEAGVIVTSWNIEPALTPLAIAVLNGSMNRIEVDVIEGAIVVRSVGVSPSR